MLGKSGRVVVLAILLAGCGDPRGQGGAKATAPTLVPPSVTVEPESVTRQARLQGRIEALDRTVVASEMTARVETVRVDVGDVVQEGQTLVTLRDRDARARLASARANRRDSQALVIDAEAAFRRGKTLFDRKILARADLDRLTANRDSARARLKAAEADVEVARELLNHTVIQAPFRARVEARLVEPGETVTPGRALLKLVSLERLRVTADVPQSLIAPLRDGAPVTVTLGDGHRLDTATARLTPAADPSTQSFQLKAALPTAADVFPGTLVTVTFPAGVDKRLLVPAGALVRRRDLTALYVLSDGNRVGFRQVRVGATVPPHRVIVLSGLAPGEKVILDPVAADRLLKAQRQP